MMKWSVLRKGNILVQIVWSDLEVLLWHVWLDLNKDQTSNLVKILFV